jgi:hypothetical protein
MATLPLRQWQAGRRGDKVSSRRPTTTICKRDSTHHQKIPTPIFFCSPLRKSIWALGVSLRMKDACSGTFSFLSLEPPRGIKLFYYAAFFLILIKQTAKASCKPRERLQPPLKTNTVCLFRPFFVTTLSLFWLTGASNRPS